VQPLYWIVVVGRTWWAQSSMAELQFQEKRVFEKAEDNLADTPDK
jgi:hypothetical protein